MPTSAVYFAILASISQLPPVSHATWAPGKAAQINFFTDDICTQYNGEVAAWWTMTPMIGSMAAQAECILLSMPVNGNSQTTALVNVYEPTTATTTTPAPEANGSCTFWDGSTCTGNEASPNSACMPARSKDGVLWQSAKCFFLEALPQSMSLVRSSTSIASVSSSSLPANSTSPTSPSNISHPVPSLPISILSSSISINPASSLISMSPSAPTKPLHAMKKSVSASTIVGLTVGAATTLIAILAFCTWRARRRRETFFPTQGYFLPPAGQYRPPVRQKLGAGPIATELRTSRQDLRRNNGTNGDGTTNLDLAMRQNNILEARIRALERAYVGPQVPDPSPALPPRYQDGALAETTTARPGHRSE